MTLSKNRVFQSRYWISLSIQSNESNHILIVYEDRNYSIEQTMVVISLAKSLGDREKTHADHRQIVAIREVFGVAFACEFHAS